MACRESAELVCRVLYIVYYVHARREDVTRMLLKSRDGPVFGDSIDEVVPLQLAVTSKPDTEAQLYFFARSAASTASGAFFSTAQSSGV